MNLKNTIATFAMAAAVVGMTGCTTASRNVMRGETTEATSRLTEQDIRTIITPVVGGIVEKSARYKPANGGKYVVNVKKVTVDTTSRGSQADYLATTIKTSFEEELTDRGIFYVYDEQMALANAAAGRPVTMTPQFVLASTLAEQNIRRDDGDIYREYSLMVRLIDASNNMQMWQKRVPMQKVVDKSRVNQ